MGNGATNDSNSPVAVTMGDSVTAEQISAGGEHTCAIFNDDKVYCWGENGLGQLGLGSTTDGNAPAAVDLGNSATATAIGTGRNHTCAILDDNSVKCWGDNDFGQLGDASTENRTSPVAVSLESGRTATAIHVKGDYTCAILDDGSLVCWGYNANQQLGDWTTTNRNTPQYVDLGEDRTATAIGGGTNHTCAILDDDSLKCWGDNRFGQTGIPTPHRGDQAGETGENLLLVDLDKGAAAPPSFTDGGCASSDSAPDMILTEEDGVWVFRVPEQGNYDCPISNLVETRGLFPGRRFFSNLSGVPLKRANQGLDVIGDVTSEIYRGRIQFANNNIYTGDQESDILTIGSRKFKMIVIDDETPTGPFFSDFISGNKIETCPSASTHPAPDMTLTEENGVWVFRVPEQGKYECSMKNIVESGGHQGNYHFSGLSGIPENNDHQLFGVGAVARGENVHNGGIGFNRHASNDDNTFQGDRESSVLTIGSRKFKMIVIDDDEPPDPFFSDFISGNKVETCPSASTHPAPDMTLTLESGVWVFRVPEQGKYECSMKNIVESGGHTGNYHFSGLSGIPKNSDHQLFAVGVVARGENVHNGGIGFNRHASNDDNTFQGDRESSVLTIGSRKFKMIVIDDEIQW